MGQALARYRMERTNNPNSHMSSVFASTSSILLGKMILPDPVAIPLSSDELLDWMEQVQLVSVYLKGEELLVDGETSPVLPFREGCASVIKFVPFVQTSRQDALIRLPSMSWIEKAKLYSDAIVIALYDDDERIGTVRTFAFFQYHALSSKLLALLSLLEIQRTSQMGDSSDRSCLTTAATACTAGSLPLKDCSICESEAENCILPCGHALCEECERRWVQRYLDCPFCRQRFSSSSEIQNNGWQLASYLSQDDLQQDILDLEYKIMELWEKEWTQAKQQNETNSLNTTGPKYVFVRRTVGETHEQDDFMVVEGAKISSTCKDEEAQQTNLCFTAQETTENV